MIAIILLSIIVAYLILTGIVVYLTARFPKARIFKRINGTVALIVMLLVPTWDILPGVYHFNKLCADAGLHVYKTIKVDGFYYKDAGSGIADYLLRKKGFKYIEAEDEKAARKLAKYHLSKDGVLLKESIKKPKSRYILSENWKIDEGLNSAKFEHEVRDRENGEVLAVFRVYGYFGNWVQSIIGRSLQGMATYCPKTNEGLSGLYSDVLIPSSINE